MKVVRIFLIAALIGLAGFPPVVTAEETEAARSKAGSWIFSVTPYFWISYIDGTAVVQGREADFDMSAGDLFKLVDFGVMAHGEAWRGKLGLTTDVMYFNLGNEVGLRYGTAGVDVETDSNLLFWEFGGGYLLRGMPYAGKFDGSPSGGTPLLSLEGLFGVRYVRMDASLEFTADPGVEGREKIVGKKEGTQSWYEPYFGVRIPIRATEKLSFPIRGDIAGFGAGSELTWNVIVGVDYEVHRHVALGLGCRILDIDYEEGDGAEKFAFDAMMVGPAFAATFGF